MPSRTQFSESWMQSSIISNEKVFYLYLEVLPENRRISFLHSTNSESDFVCCLKVNKLKLTTLSDLVEESRSYLQLFLELPETFWSLRTTWFCKKSSKSVLLWFLGFTNLTSCLIYDTHHLYFLGSKLLNKSFISEQKQKLIHNSDF